MNGVPAEGLQPIKITAVGDGMVGKTCLLITYTNKQFPEDYVPTVLDRYTDTITVDGQEYILNLWDTAGQEQYDRLRSIVYPETDCFLMCYAVNSASSYHNIPLLWWQEVSKYCPGVPIVLVGTKADVADEGRREVSHMDGITLKSQLNASAFVECSAKSLQRVDGLFEEVVRTVRDWRERGRGRKGRRRKRRKVCDIL